MNQYTLVITVDEGFSVYDTLAVVIMSDRTIQETKNLIEKVQQQHHFLSPEDLLQYVCDETGMQWEPFHYDISIAYKI